MRPWWTAEQWSIRLLPGCRPRAASPRASGWRSLRDIVYSKKGKDYSNSFMQYKIPSRLDVGKIRVEFESSYEPTGPFGAKSIGEIVINTPSPAIINAIQNAVGRDDPGAPATAEKVYRGMHELKELNLIQKK